MATIDPRRRINALKSRKPMAYLTRTLPKKAMAVLEDLLTLTTWPEEGPPPYGTIVSYAQNVEILLPLLTDRIDAALMDACPDLKLIAQYAVGFDNIDIAAATERGIYVTNTPGVLTEAVADFTFGLILAIGRRITEGDQMVRSGNWSISWAPTLLLGSDIYSKTLGIVGFGLIGQAVARRAKGFGMTILYYDLDRRITAEDSTGATFSDLDSLLKVSDFVSIHTALTAQSRHLIGARELGLMKDDAYFINTARGGIVDQQALYEALNEKRIKGAALDVFTAEPLEADDPLLTLDNIVLAPHAASSSIEARTNMALLVAKNVEACLHHNCPPTLVNREVLALNPIEGS